MLQIIEEVGQSRAKIAKLLFVPVSIDVLAQSGVLVDVVGGPENENDIGIAQLVHALDEGLAGIVGAAFKVGEIADQRT